MQILIETLIGGLYGVVGIVVMGLGYLMVDLVTPGSLGTIVWRDRNRGGAVVLAGALLGVGWIVATAIGTSEEGLAAGLVSTAAYGVIGLILMAVVFGLVGLVTPGKMGAQVLEDEDGHPHPAAWVVAAIYVATALVVSAAIA